MISSYEQLNVKRRILQSLLAELGVEKDHYIEAHAAEPYGYRNRIRLRIHRIDGVFRFGYNIRTTTDFLPITTCPISAPNLIPTVEALLALAAEDRDAEYWLNAIAEIELFTNDDLSRVQLTLFVAPRTKAPQGSFTRMMNALQQRAPQVVGAAAAAFDPRTGPTGRILAEHGASGLNYKVGDQTYWISRGGFFQVNRLLVDTLVKLVTENRSGNIAWDLFAGVGLFSRILARNFAQVTAVESSPIASADLAAAFKRLGPQHRAVAETTLAFLQKAITRRERPDLIVLDPPRAGAGLEACALLSRIAAPQIVYVSCDPTTLARDLAALQSTYRIDELHLVDLFPQTFHIETIAILTRTKPSLRSTL
ncbi:MAG TPA: RsmD family RNA methyltransferase [Acidobacteriaceae bacterium]|nr:RsmD family RNA methyltransferase [Acidobacteriaceae bacterium]